MPKSSSDPLQCQECQSKPATLFITKTLGNKVVRQNLCESCARTVAALQIGDRAVAAPLEEILRVLFQSEAPPPSPLDIAAASPDWWRNLVESPNASPQPPSPQLPSDEFSADEDIADQQAETNETDNVNNDVVAENDLFDEPDFDTSASEANEEQQDADSSSTRDDLSELFAAPDSAFTPDASSSDAMSNSQNASLVPSVRCPKCGTTWDRLKQDGRAGCAACYVAFADDVTKVLERMQKSAIHEGKTPRSAEKRQKRLLHLRLRRDHRLEMLQRRLDESLQKEDYEEAAKLRDKIKVVTSTIVEE